MQVGAGWGGEQPRIAASKLTASTHPYHLFELWFDKDWRKKHLVDNTNLAPMLDGYQTGKGTTSYPEVETFDLRYVDTYLAMNN